MHAVIHHSFGDPAAVLAVETVPTPEPGPGEVRVRLLASPIHNHDLWTVRGTYGSVKRHDRATVRAQDLSGAWFERGAGGILAQAFQHEIDHLDGILFIDHAHKLFEKRRAGESESEHA